MSTTSFELPVWAWILLGALLLAQSIWIFRDASRRGERRVLWGLLGLLNVPSSLIVYLLVTRRLVRTRPCGACGQRIGQSDRFCRVCGARQPPPA